VSVVVGQRSETVRRANLSAIVRELHLRGPLSRSELVTATGLTRSAIRSLIGELVTAGLVIEERATPVGTPGRPSPVVRLDPEAAVALALELTVDSLGAAIVGIGGHVLEYLRVDRPRGHSSLDDIAADLVALAARVSASRGRREATIGVGVAVCGVVRRFDGLVSMAPNLGWRDVPLGEALARSLDGNLTIAVANDGDLGALAELRRGAARGADNVLFVSGEVGVGGGLIVEGRPMTGVAGYAGEVGHMPVNPAGQPCRCGSVGCWETEVGEPALLRRAGRDPAGGQEAVDDVLRAAEAGDPQALAALDEVGRWLGIGLAGLVNLFNPRLVVLGGVLGRIFPYVHARVDEQLDQRALSAPRRLVTVVPAELGVDAPLVGAAELAIEPLLADPAAWLRHPSASRARASA
jgi:predicted NBD/HSP70 family sugar kinase